jgi:hypothetical protein
MCRKGNNLWRTSLDRLGRVGLSVIFGNEIRGEWRGPRSGKAGGVPVEIASVPVEHCFKRVRELSCWKR